MVFITGRFMLSHALIFCSRVLFSVLLAVWLPRLGKRERAYVLLVHLFVYFARVDFSPFSLPLGTGKTENEPSHDKNNKMTVRPAQTQTSLGIRPDWSESSLCAQWVVKDPSFLHADGEDWSDWAYAHADLSLRWAHMPFCWFCH